MTTGTSRLERRRPCTKSVWVQFELDRSVGAISGGEAMLVAIAGIRLRRAPITLLDEPTNNLDRAARNVLARTLDGWPGTLVVVSHDTGLLDQMDSTAELHNGALTVFGGPFSAWRAHLAAEQAAASQAARTAEQAFKVEKRQRVEAEMKLASRNRDRAKGVREQTRPQDRGEPAGVGCAGIGGPAADRPRRPGGLRAGRARRGRRTRP